MRLIAASLIALMLPAAAAAQPSAAAETPVLGERMAPLQAMVGRWTGEGWMLLPNGRRETFRSSETVTPRLNGAALLIEGLHRSAASGEIVHDAMAMLVWDRQQNGYRMRSQLANGHGGDFPLTVTPTGFSWRMETPGGRIDYVAEVSADRWVERGTRTATDGRAIPFFEMSLRRE